MEAEIKKRLRWIQLYERIGSAGIVCRKCGISRPTLRKRLQRYTSHGVDGLNDISKRPHSSPSRKVKPEHEVLILDLRKSRKLGHRRIVHELKRLHDLSLSVATIHKVLARHNEKYLHLKRHYRKKYCRYSRLVPGGRPAYNSTIRLFSDF
ncbi:MAG: helix-turn-helix domain containing protein [Chlorobiaceae bacterium]|nr:helix-turn-helix domain containing protein [Chlorobiaceae bacterium]